MATIVAMPTLGGMMEEGTITKWYKQIGDSVMEGEPLLEVLTDKANMEVESPASGILREIVKAEGENVPVQKPIAIIGSADEPIDDLLSGNGAKPAATAPNAAPAPSTPVPAATQAPAKAESGRIIASPKARKFAADNGVDMALLAGKGTGPEGRISEADVQTYLDSLKTTAPAQPAVQAPQVEIGSSRTVMSVSIAPNKNKTTSVKLDKKQLMSFLETMLRIRYFEEAVQALSQQGLLGGAAHLSVGQEAIAVGACSAIEPTDYITSTHRGHGHCIAKGGDVPRMMAEVVGKTDGYCKGKGGSMHIADFSIGICGANGIVGGGLPISAGLGLSSQYKSDGRVTLCFFGDGASNQGSFHESVNMASLWKLPVVYICENNQYAMTTQVSNGCCIDSIAKRAASYNIPGKTIDGNDVLTVYREVGKAVEHARSGKGPVLLECMTYRQSGHYAGDPCPYRTTDELCRWQDENDPIKRFKEYLVSNGVATNADIVAMEARVLTDTQEAVEFAKVSPMPDLAEASTDVFSAPLVLPSKSSVKLPAPGSREITYREAINEALSQAMEKDDRVFLIGEDICFGAFRVTHGLTDKFGSERVRCTPISEAAIVGSAVGASATGLVPVAEIMYIDFTTVGMDQIINQAAKFHFMSGGTVNLPMVIRTPGGSGGRGNAAQHSQSLEALFMHIPGLKVVIPSTPYDAKGLLISAINDPDPVIYIEHKTLYNVKAPVPEEYYSIPFGLADVKRPGSDVTLVTYSRMLNYSLQAAELLAKEGIDVEIVDLRTLVPLDIETVAKSVMRTSKVMIVEEDCKTGGVGAELVALITEHVFDYLDAPPVRVAGLDVPIAYAPLLEKASVPSPDSIAVAAIKLVRG